MKEPRNKKGNPKKHYDKYYNAYLCAKGRGIEWQFTYDTWIEWWGDDIANRGPYKGQLVMARNGDIGPYHPDNVHKATSTDNHKERKINGGEAKRIATLQANIAKRKEMEMI